MGTQPQYPDSSAAARSTSQVAPDPLAGPNVDDRADLEEDRRRQRELDDGELGGEA
jgi:hypothetical protein